MAADLSRPPADRDVEPLWRQLLGRRLRMLRIAKGQKLTELAARAGISPQYLSEVERELKEPSSEMIAAIVGALGLTLLDLTGQVADDLRSSARLATVTSLDRRSQVSVLAFAA